MMPLLYGCLDANTVIHVNKDGSGTVTETIKVKESLMPWAGTNQVAFTLAGNKSRLANRALAMGRNVNLTSVQDLQEQGVIGYIAVYAFKDIRTLNIDLQPDATMLGQLAPGQTDKRRIVTFALNTDNSSLVINIPRRGMNETSMSRPAFQPLPKNLVSEQRAVVRTMFEKFRIQLRVTVQGTIGRTNATSVEPGNRNTVVLLDLNIDKLLEDDRQLDKLLTMGQIDDIDTARIKLAGLPGIKIEPSDHVTIEFK
ncbi:MAG: hypothetical protein WCN95_03645 [bacterium]